jgi:hypothetical protein
MLLVAPPAPPHSLTLDVFAEMEDPHPHDLYFSWPDLVADPFPEEIYLSWRDLVDPDPEEIYFSWQDIIGDLYLKQDSPPLWHRSRTVRISLGGMTRKAI